MKTLVNKTMLREVMKDCKLQMNRIIDKGGSPLSAAYMGAKFNYFFASMKLNGVNEKRFAKVKAMYHDFHTVAKEEGWTPTMIAMFE